uniref:Uncharacterized protein n=1 Tax=Rhizophora mucronata TaxID=61149 RepID=A0A2P2PUB2_RHIMU
MQVKKILCIMCLYSYAFIKRFKLFVLPETLAI